MGIKRVRQLIFAIPGSKYIIIYEVQRIHFDIDQRNKKSLNSLEGHGLTHWMQRVGAEVSLCCKQRPLLDFKHFS